MSLYYVQAEGDTFIRHIFDSEPTRWDEDNFCRVVKLTPEQIEKFGVHQLKLVTPPYYDPATQTREHGPALLIDGVWTQNYIVSEFDADESAAMIEAQWTVIRAARNKILADTDWWVMKAMETNVTISAERHAYRQALRDITDQVNPLNIIWPTKPE